MILLRKQSLPSARRLPQHVELLFFFIQSKETKFPIFLTLLFRDYCLIIAQKKVVSIASPIIFFGATGNSPHQIFWHPCKVKARLRVGLGFWLSPCGCAPPPPVLRRSARTLPSKTETREHLSPRMHPPAGPATTEYRQRPDLLFQRQIVIRQRTHPPKRRGPKRTPRPRAALR
jgi:hypothetical protein